MKINTKVPNIEQKKSIEHNGNILLSAGAGSGKTFVLIEHLVYLIEGFEKKYKSLSTEILQTKIRTDCSSIVVMTFTKKAAGELKIRFQTRIKKIFNDESRDEQRRKIFLYASDAITITTIHGFCNKLLKSGYISNTPSEFQIISTHDLFYRVQKYFKRWWGNIADRNDPIMKLIISHEEQLLKSMTNIFSSPELRIMWDNLNPKDENSWAFDNYFYECMAALDILDIFQDEFSFSEYIEKKDQKWYIFFTKFEKIKNKLLTDGFNFIPTFLLFLDDEFCRMPTLKQSSEFVRNRFIKIKTLRDFFKKNGESFEAFIKFKTPFFSKWIFVLKDIYEYVNRNYEIDSSRTFADLEYYVYKGLSTNASDLIRTRKNFNYLIVDEFQDTSKLQYDILKLILGNDFKRLFAVGDIKQAIYGFRGGEMGVFLQCSEDIGEVNYLKNNYRSEMAITNFNNLFFDNVFLKGRGYKGIDSCKIPFEKQKIPKKDKNGEIYKYIIRVEDTGSKFTSSQINEIEAEQIKKRIDLLLDQDPQNDICILYKKLSPANLLIKKLLDDDIGFDAQVKVPVEEDPLWNIFKILQENANASKDEKVLKNAVTLVEAYFSYFRGENIKNDVITETIVQYTRDVSVLGALEAYRKFLFSNGVKNSNVENNLQLIETINKNCDDDFEKGLIAISSKEGENYSINFRNKGGNENIKIMTCHASKGLEFEHVIFAGIHTNGRSFAGHNLVGNFPASFSWKTEYGQKKIFKSPNLILEGLVSVKKDFSESKRLFYVAGTRAKKSLSWIDISVGEKMFYSHPDSWIQGIRSWENDNAENILEIEKEILLSKEEINICNIKDDESNFKTPLFMDDPMGILMMDSLKTRNLGLVSELSVTRFSSIVECPKKFYLQNICKIDEEDLVLPFFDEEKMFLEEDSLQNEDEIIFSTKERGTKIHILLSKFLKNNKYFAEKGILSSDEKKILDWCNQQLTSYREKYKLMIEIPMKFELFGYMLSGIPDLVMIPKIKGMPGIIWDFKTGSRKKDSEESYWCQLYSYAKAMIELKLFDPDSFLQIAIVYLDEFEIIQRKLTTQDVDKYIYSKWQLLARLDQINNKHCNICKFKNLCATSCVN